jgi:hypothetical protein
MVGSTLLARRGRRMGSILPPRRGGRRRGQRRRIASNSRRPHSKRKTFTPRLGRELARPALSILIACGLAASPLLCSPGSAQTIGLRRSNRSVEAGAASPRPIDRRVISSMMYSGTCPTWIGSAENGVVLNLGGRRRGRDTASPLPRPTLHAPDGSRAANFQPAAGGTARLFPSHLRGGRGRCCVVASSWQLP